MEPEQVSNIPGRCTCSICGAVWRPKRNKLPQRCPHCKSKLWNSSYRHRCHKCGHEWTSSNIRPNRCPSCQTRKWASETHQPETKALSSLPEKTKKSIMVLYNSGLGCTRISIRMKIPFGDVYNVVKENSPDDQIRI